MRTTMRSNESAKTFQPLQGYFGMIALTMLMIVA